MTAGPETRGPRPIRLRADPPAVLAVPPAHLELRWRALTADDAGALTEVLDRIASADGGTGPADGSEVVEGDWKDLEADTLGGFDQDGVLRAFGAVDVRPGDRRTVRAWLTGGIDPRWRGRGIGRAVLSWIEGRGRQKLAETGTDLPARLAVRVDSEARDARRLYAAGGFSPIRWYTTMRRSLVETPPRAEPPDGVRVTGWSPELDERVRTAHNEVFADHWGSEPRGPEEWRLRGGAIVPRWSLVALDRRDDEIAGYVVSRDPSTPGVAHTDLLGVRRSWRGHGLAAALLTAALDAYRSDGMEHATLEVDADNPSGAYDWYRRLGYRPVRTQILYTVEI